MRRKKNISRIIAAFIAFGVSIGFIASTINDVKAAPLHADELNETFTYASMSGTYLSYSLDQNGGATAPNTNSDIRIYNKNTLTFTANPAYSSSIAITSVSITGKNSKSGNTQTVYYDPVGGTKVTQGSNITWGTGTGSATRTATFTGENLTSVVFYQGGSNNVQISSVTVYFTYNPSSGGGDSSSGVPISSSSSSNSSSQPSSSGNSESQQHNYNYNPYTYTGNYYDTFDFDATGGMNGNLRTALTTKIRPAAFYTYSGSGTDHLSTQLQYADEDPENSSNMIYFYTRNSVAKNAADTWNREHVWPQSLSNNNWGESEGGTDLLHLRPTYSSTNSSRGNTPYGDINKTSPKYFDVDTLKVTENSNKTLFGYCDGTYFEPLDCVKGDVARIIMYIWTTYTGWVGNKTYNSLNILSVMQSYDTLLRWHTLDQPDALEGHRNDYVQSSDQQNRNPFVDHPELAWKIFGDEASANVKNACMEAYPANGGANPIEPTGVTLNQTSADLEVNDTLQLTATIQPNGATGSITWSSNNTNVAAVSNTGLVTAVSEGNATITARVSENIAATCIVSVTDNVAPVSQYTKIASYDFSSNSASNSECTNDELLALFNNNAASGNGLSDIVSAISETSKTYPAYTGYASFGLKFGTSSANGTFATTLSERVARVVVKTAGWGTTDSLKVGDADAQVPGVAYNGSNPIKTLTYDITPSSSITFTYAKRGFIQTIDFYAVEESVNDLLGYASSVATILGNENTTGDVNTYSIAFANAGLDNSADIGTISIGGATLTAGSGPKYYTSDLSMRVYKNNTFTISAPETINSITFTCPNGYSSGLTASVGTISNDVNWIGSATSITFTNSNDSDQIRFTAISIICGEVETTVDNVVLRFGAILPVDSWTAINDEWPITDYGVMLVKQTTLSNVYHETSVENAFRNHQTLADYHSGTGVPPTPNGNQYAFTARVRMTNVNNYNVVYCAAPYIVAGGEYYFLEEMRYSVNTLAAYCLDNSDTSPLSIAALNVLAGN